MESVAETVLSYAEDGVLVLTLNRPEKLNALTQEMYSQLNTGLDQASVSDDIGAVLIAAHGEHFSAGNDLQDFMSMAMGTEALNPSEIPVVGFIHRLVAFEKPLFVAVQGQAVGIGLTLTLHADAVYLADTALLSAPFADLGLVPEAGSSLILPTRVGQLRAAEILLAAKTIDAKTTLDWGLANGVTTADKLLDSTLTAAKQVAVKPREAIKLSKQLMKTDKKAIADHVNKELEVFFGRLRSDEAKAAFAAFLAR